MRINLQCPFQDKDLAKQRGARWDPRLRVWYVQDVADLGPFAAWLPRAPDGDPLPPSPARTPERSRSEARQHPAKVAVTTGQAHPAGAACVCDVLPWEHCACTRRPSGAAA